MAATHALDLLDRKKFEERPVYALVGEDPFLRREVRRRIRQAVLAAEDDEFSRTVYEGSSASMVDVRDELSTRGLFGDSRRLVEVEDADDFISKHRPELESYAAQPKSSGVLVLVAKSMPSNTKLYKAIDKLGGVIQCQTPKEPKIKKWLISWAQANYDKQLASDAADLMLELVGPELGLLDQELAKVASLAGEAPRMSLEMVEKIVGGWRAQTVWEMLDAAAEGRAPAALEQLDKLLMAGEHPIAILAQISASLRRYADAARALVVAESEGKRMSVRQALEQAGIKPFVLAKAERQLRQLGRERATQLHRWLVETDLDLKGESALPPRTILERLIARMAQDSQFSASGSR